MPLQPSKAITRAFAPPVMEARRWLQDATFSDEMPLINLSQAAPIDPPPEELRAELARFITDEPSAHIYGPVLGLPALRETLAETWQGWYGGSVKADNVAITSGCNQAFCAVVAALTDPGDEIIVPVPWYFNHKMLLDMNSLRAVPLPCGPDMLPSVDAASAVIGPRTRAIALVTPNNPTGAEYPPELLEAFRDLARARGIALIVDETYRDFHSKGVTPHSLLTDPNWDDTVIQLYSFSKVYRLTGHRVGAVIAAPTLLREIEKYLDTVAICPNQIGQHGALYGLKNLSQWVAGERLEVLRRRDAVEAAFAGHPTFTLTASGAYFAWLSYDGTPPSDMLAPKLVQEAGILMLPGTMFAPPEAGDLGPKSFRAAFANADAQTLKTFADRLTQIRL